MATTNMKPSPAVANQAQGHAHKKTSSNRETAAGSNEADAGDSDVSDDENMNDETNEADVFALSNARISEQHLAGLDDDMFTSDAVAGASVSGEDDDDDDYTGVADVSDDEEDVGEDNEDVVRRAAERDLIAEFDRAEQRRDTAEMAAEMDSMFLGTNQQDALARELGLASDSAGPTEFNYDVDMNDDPFVGLDLGDSLYRDMYDDAERALGIWDQASTPLARHNSEESTETKKRVRFAEPQETFSRSSSMSSVDEDQDPNEIFPDLFDVQDDPALRQQFGLDVDIDAQFSFDFDDSGSVYDFDGDEERLAVVVDDEESDSDDMSSSSGSDNESDNEGDTTDEEIEEETAAREELMRKRRLSAARNAAPSTPTPAKRAVGVSARSTGSPATPRTGGGKGPRIGKFVIDKTKAVMSADPTGKFMTVRPPSRPSEQDKDFWKRHQNATAANSRASTPRSGMQHRRTSSKHDAPLRPFTAQSTLGTMFNGNLDILQNNSTPDIRSDFTTAFIPRPQSSYAGTLHASSDEEEEEDVDMSEFIDLDEYGSDSDNEEPQSASSIMSPQLDLTSSMSNLDTRRSENNLLDHLDQSRGLVGSFRRNQNFTKHVSSLASHPAKRASTMETNALLKGRRSAANIPITPLRKKRVSQDLSMTGSGVKKNVSSPLSGRRPRSRGGSISAGMQQTLGPSLM
ncbi:hypothetical protein LTR86_009387 [Recurvomyces mirabilis]|nr:hypothetical protein LTR86_009387 [Recurvomyces mirabilis]